MCDEHTQADNDRLLSRRTFGGMVGAAGLSAMLPAPANAATIAGKDVLVTTPDGACDAYYVAPTTGKHPGVIVWPDIMGLRPAFRQMADRLSQSGYAVLTVNPFYRSVKSPFVTPGQGFDDVLRAKVGPWRTAMTPDAVKRDAIAYAAFLDKQPGVDKTKGLATTGYCMGGPLVMQTAAAVPTRVRAAGTFHGGGMAADPMLALIPAMKAHYLICVAENDDQRAPTDKDKLKTAFAAAKLPAEIEVYTGTQHGWCPPDSQVYNQAQADKAWGRMLELFKTSL